jgi:hypothetical protein
VKGAEMNVELYTMQGNPIKTFEINRPNHPAPQVLVFEQSVYVFREAVGGARRYQAVPFVFIGEHDVVQTIAPMH